MNGISHMKKEHFIVKRQLFLQLEIQTYYLSVYNQKILSTLPQVIITICIGNNDYWQYYLKYTVINKDLAGDLAILS